jgi:hypothetical protein
MRFIFPALVFAAALPALAASPAPSSDEAALLQLKQHDWPKAYFTQNTKLLDAILHDKFQMIDASGEKSSKAQEMDYVAKNKPGYACLTYKVTRLDIFPNGTAIVSGEGTVIGLPKAGLVSTTNYQSTNVMLKVEGKWKAVASHVSGIKQATATVANPK